MSSSPSPSDPKALLEELLALMGVEAVVQQQSLDDMPLLQIESPDAAQLIGKFGQTLNDLQWLLNRILLKQSGFPAEGEPRSPRIIVDVGRYRERQRDDLLRMAGEAADKVRRWGDPVQLEPLNAFERRLIHRHFANDSEIETISSEEVWEGGRKRITLRLRHNSSSTPKQEDVSEE